jgi:transcriptional regulator with XRE-family HTH domain
MIAVTKTWTAAGSLVWMARTGAGLTQRELAEAAGVPQSTVAAIEAGRRQPSLPLLERILAGAGQELRLHLTAKDPSDTQPAPDGRGDRRVARLFRSARVVG